MSGFLIENSLVYKGGAVIAQRKAMIAACEKAGPGQLVHPTLGSMTVSLIDASAGEQWDSGRVFEIKFVFLESGQRLYPSSGTSTEDATNTAAATANSSTGSAFSSVLAGIASGAAVVNQAVATANTVIDKVIDLAADATNAMHLVAVLAASLPASLVGSLGRYTSGALTGFMPGATPTALQLASQNATTASLIALGAAGRANVGAAGDAMNAAATALSLTSPAPYAAAAQGLVAALLSGTVDPADSVRVLAQLSNYAPIQSDATPVAWAPGAAMQGAANDLFRRSAVIALAQASATYQPSSSNDAVNVRTLVINLLNWEIEIAGDQGADAVFNALRALAGAVSLDLTTRGASLPSITQYSARASLPAAVIAQRLYRDPGRADELIREANSPHPAFMPLNFEVLSS